MEILNEALRGHSFKIGDALGLDFFLQELESVESVVFNLDASIADICIQELLDHQVLLVVVEVRVQANYI